MFGWLVNGEMACECVSACGHRSLCTGVFVNKIPKFSQAEGS